MGCNCWNSNEGSDQDYLKSKAESSPAPYLAIFLAELQTHLAKGHTLSLLKRFELEGERALAALEKLRSWLVSGGPYDSADPMGRHKMPEISYPDEVDPSGDLDQAWHALILSDTSWYMQVTEQLYGRPLHHIENTEPRTR